MSETHAPGAIAGKPGHYEEHDRLGIRTGRLTYVREGATLPSIPCGHTWRKIAGEEAADG
jgi:hypothetical protein